MLFNEGEAYEDHKAERARQGQGLVCRRWTGGSSIRTISLNLLVGLALLSGSGPLVDGQQPSASPVATPASVVHVLGLENIKRNAKGNLTVQGDTVQFKSGTAKAEVSIPSVQDVFTEQDYKQSIGGTAGTVAKLAVPYGGGRVLSLFHERVDVLTVEYRDANGGLHGAIFTLPQGQASGLKKQLVAQGAHASIPPEEPAKQEEKKE